MSAAGQNPAIVKTTANVKRLILILSKNYEENPKVVLRELIQNAADASTKSRKEDPERQYQLEVEIIPPEERSRYAADISVRDFAGGMNADSFAHYLACLGETGKEDDIDLIGEWGIGFYALVVIAKSAVIISKTTTSDAVVYRYIVSDDEYMPVDERTKQDLIAREFRDGRKSGTTVMVEVDFDKHPQLRDWLNPDRLNTELRSYCLVIPYSIYVVNNRTRIPTPVNLAKPPWECSGVEREDALPELWRRVLVHSNSETYPKLTYSFRVGDSALEVGGILYFIERYEGGASLYYKHMFVETGMDLLPRWAAPFTALVDVKSRTSAPLHLTVPPSRTHIVRDEAYFVFSDKIETEVFKMIDGEMANYKNNLQAALLSAPHPERKSEKLAEVTSRAPIVSALVQVSNYLPSVCADLPEIMADALGQDYSNNHLKDCAVALVRASAPQSNTAELSRDTVVPYLRQHARYAQNRYLEEREAQKGNRKSPEWNPPSSGRFLKHAGHHLPISVVLKEYPSGRQPQFTNLRIPISCLRLLDPGLAEDQTGIVKLPVLEKGDPTEYLLSAEGERLVITAHEVEKLFLMCLSHNTKRYRLVLVSVKKNPFQDVAHPEEWADMIRILKELLKEARDQVHPASPPFAEVDVAGFERKEVPLVTREVNGRSHLTINAWNRGLKSLNETLKKALQHGIREQRVLSTTLHELYHFAVHDESASLSQGTLHLLDVKEQALIETCELLNELFDTRRSRV